MKNVEYPYLLSSLQEVMLPDLLTELPFGTSPKRITRGASGRAQSR